jgi:hypothetical protein
MDSDIDKRWINYEINLRGIYWVSKAVLPLMLKGARRRL